MSNEAKKFNTKNIFLGHTSTDKAETILFNIIRGTGLKGLEGITKLTTKKINTKNYFIMRPLLEIDRVTTEKICKENGLVPLQDKTNDDLKYTRNKIRKTIFPLLKEINPKVIQSLLNLGSAAKETNESYELLVKTWYAKLVSIDNSNSKTIFKIKDINAFNQLTTKLKTEIIKNILNHISIPKQQITAKHIIKITELISLQGTKYYDLPNKVKFTKEYNMASFEYSGFKNLSNYFI